MTVSITANGKVLEIQVTNSPAPVQNISIPVDDVIITRTGNTFSVSGGKLQNITFNYADVTAPVEANAADLETAIQNMLNKSGAETFTAVLATDSTGSPIVAGAYSVTFTTSSDFVGTILGVARTPSTTYAFKIATPGRTLGAFAYTVTAGSMTIDKSL